MLYVNLEYITLSGNFWRNCLIYFSDWERIRCFRLRRFPSGYSLFGESERCSRSIWNWVATFHIWFAKRNSGFWLCSWRYILDTIQDFLCIKPRIIVKPTKIFKDLCNVLALQSSLIILVALIMAWYIVKNYGFMPNSHKNLEWYLVHME